MMMFRGKCSLPLPGEDEVRLGVRLGECCQGANVASFQC